MYRIPTNSPDRLAYAVPAKLMPGLIKVLGGGTMMIVGGMVIPPAELFSGKLLTANSFPGGLIFLALFGLFPGLSVFFGLRQLLYRSRMEFDLASGTVRCWEGSFLMREHSFPLSEYRAVEIGSAMIERGRHEREFVYPFALVGFDGRASLITARESESARRAAEEIALFLKYDLIDATTGTVRHDSADQVGVPLAERLRRSAAEDSVTNASSATVARDKPDRQPEVPPPAGARSTAQIRDGRLTIEIPAQRWSSFFSSLLIMPAIFLGIGVFLSVVVLGAMALFEKDAVDWGNHFVSAFRITLGFGVVGLVIGLLFELPGLWTRTTIVVDSAGILLRSRGLLSKNERLIPASEIRELRLAAVVTRDQLITFDTSDIDLPEMEWLHHAITKALSSDLGRSE